MYSGFLHQINKTDRHDIAEILLKVAFDTINQTFDLTVDNTYSRYCETVEILGYQFLLLLGKYVCFVYT